MVRMWLGRWDVDRKIWTSHIAMWLENQRNLVCSERKGEADVQKAAEMRGSVCSWVADKLPRPQFLRLGYIPALRLHETPLILKPHPPHCASASSIWFLLVSSKSILTNTRKFLFDDFRAHIVPPHFTAQTILSQYLTSKSKYWFVPSLIEAEH